MNNHDEAEPMSPNVVSLTDLINSRKEQQQKVIDLLSEMLDMAREGSLQGVLVCMDVKDGKDELHVAGTYKERTLLARGAAASIFHYVHRATD